MLLCRSVPSQARDRDWFSNRDFYDGGSCGQLDPHEAAAAVHRAGADKIDPQLKLQHPVGMSELGPNEHLDLLFWGERPRLTGALIGSMGTLSCRH